MDIIIFDNVINFLNESNHDINHALAVYYNANIIANADYPDICDPEILMYASMLHDKSINKLALSNFLINTIDRSKADFIMEIINMHTHQPYLDILSDANRLEEISLERCINYARKMNKNIPFDVIQYCHEKLLRISTEFIHTKKGKAMAKPMHDTLVKDLDKLINGVYK